MSALRLLPPLLLVVSSITPGCRVSLDAPTAVAVSCRADGVCPADQVCVSSGLCVPLTSGCLAPGEAVPRELDDGAPCVLAGVDVAVCLGGACRAASCGDGIVTPPERCDSGDARGFGSGQCRPSCELPGCGDGVVDPGEACDDGLANGNGISGCTTGCTVDVCGNGYKGPGEECDDGNNNDFDACRSNCRSAVCGDAVTWAGVEECDDGNTRNNDGCTGGCVVEPFCQQFNVLPPSTPSAAIACPSGRNRVCFTTAPTSFDRAKAAIACSVCAAPTQVCVAVSSACGGNEAFVAVDSNNNESTIGFLYQNQCTSACCQGSIINTGTSNRLGSWWIYP